MTLQIQYSYSFLLSDRFVSSLVQGEKETKPLKSSNQTAGNVNFWQHPSFGGVAGPKGKAASSGLGLKSWIIL